MKNIFSRILVIATIIALLLNTFPQNVLAEDNLSSESSGTSESNISIDNNSAVVAEAERQNSSDFNSMQNLYDQDFSAIVGELTDKRGKYTKQFRKADGIIEADIYGSAVNYQKPDGTWVEVDNTFNQAKDTKGNPVLKTKDNGYMNVTLSQQSNQGNLVSITKGKYVISWKFDNTTSLLPIIAATTEPSSTDIPSTDITATSDATATPDVTATADTTAAPDATATADTTAAPDATATPDTAATPETIVSSDATAAPDATVTSDATATPDATVTSDATATPDATDSAATPNPTVTLAATPDVTDTNSTSSSSANYTTNVMKANEVAAAVIDDLSSQKSIMSDNDKKRLADKSKSHVEYKDILPGISLEYYIEAERVKEDIIVNQYSSDQSFTFDLNTSGLTPKKLSDGTIALSDGKNNVFYLPTLSMIDSANNETAEIKLDINSTVNGYQLVITPDDTWMQNAVYPVTIDPVVQTVEDVNDIFDTFASSSYPDTVYNNSLDLLMGNSSSYGNCNTYVQFDTNSLPVLRPGDVIVSASLKLTNDYNESSSYQYSVHNVTAAWTSSSLTWNHQPSSDSTAIDYQTVMTSNGDTGSVYSWDITNSARQWYTSGNYGVMINADSPSAGCRKFLSSDGKYTPDTEKPAVEIQYINTSGLENYWTYDSMDAGRAGTASVNDLTGNLVLSEDDIGTDGNRMPVSISHVYNTDMVKRPSNSNIGYGLGWQLNYSQTCVLVTIDGTNYYRYTDGDGTEQYFYYDSSKSAYVDESGQNRTLKTGQTVTGIDGSQLTNVLTITDKNDNVLCFNSNGWLLREQDALGNYIKIEYNSHGISKITDGAGNIYTLAYNSDYYVSSITAPGNRVISYGYDSSGNLTSITYPDDTTSQPMKSYYTYVSDSGKTDDGLLYTIKSVDNHELDFSYTKVSASGASAKVIPQVTQMIEKVGSTLGGLRTFNYAEAETTVTDQLNNVNIYQFNQYGNTVCIKDNFGRAVYSQYYTPTASTSDGGTYGQNKMSLSSKLQEPVMNNFLDSSFEVGSNWNYNLHNAGGSVTRVNSDNKFGSYCASVYDSINTGYNYYYQNMTLQKGKTYTASAWIKTSSDFSTTSGGGKISIYYWDSNDVAHSVATNLITKADDWTRYDVTFTVPSDAYTNTVQIYLMNTYSTGTVYFDGVQVEQQPVVNRYNLVQNGDMTVSTSGTPNFWTKSSGCDSSDVSTTNSDPGRGLLDSNVFKINGVDTAAKSLSQTITVSGGLGDTYSFGAWAQAYSVPLGTKKPTGSTYNRTFGIKVSLMNGSTSEGSLTVPFNTFSTNWQYASGRVIASGTYTSAVVSLLYEYNDNTAYFDGIQLYQEEFGQCYDYDKNGNVISVKSAGNTSNSSDEGTNSATYDTNNNPTSLQPPDCTGTDKYTTTYYTGNAKHEVKTTTTVMGVNNSYVYDNYGNTTQVETEDNLTSPTSLIGTQADYTPDGNYISKSYDSIGNYTQYTYNTNYGVNTSTTDPSGQTVNYTYDGNNSAVKMGKLTNVSSTVGSTTYSNDYSYTNDLLTKITHNGFDYTLGYNAFGQPMTVSVAGQNLVTNTYKTSDRSYQLDYMTYGNAGKMAYTYDSRYRVSGVSYDNEASPRYTYTYAANDQVGSVTDTQNGLTTNLYYDLADRPMKTVENYSSGFTRTFQYTYDIDNCLKEFLEMFGSTRYDMKLAYDKDNRITSMNYNDQPAGSENIRYTYDTLGRVYMHIMDTGSTDSIMRYFYNAGDTTDYGAGAASNQVSYIRYDYGGIITRTYYTYDACGRILSVSQDNASNKTVHYTYDALGQLIRTDDPTDATADPTGSTWTYAYDAGGNITSKTLYAYAYGDNDLSDNTVKHTYSYAYDATWKDKLVSVTYDNNTPQNVTSDEIGNITGYNGWTYTWEAGRQLKQMQNSGTGVTLQFKYNNAGLRTQKINGSTTTKYYWSGSVLSDMTNGTDTLHFWYDAAGKPSMVTYNGTGYYYLENQQGDIIGLLDTSGNQQVAYTYDSWGKQLSCTGSLANTLGMANPLRYRGYIYDNETGLYYLQSRYYNPDLGRFISCDAAPTDSNDLLSINQFAYCMNDPVNRTDSDGKKADWARIGVGLFNAITSIAACAAAVVGAVVTSETIVGAVACGAAAVLSANDFMSACDEIGKGISGSDKPAVNPLGDVAGGAVRGVDELGHRISKKPFTAKEQARDIDLGRTAVNFTDFASTIDSVGEDIKSISKASSVAKKIKETVNYGRDTASGIMGIGNMFSGSHWEHDGMGGMYDGSFYLYDEYFR